MNKRCLNNVCIVVHSLNARIIFIRSWCCDLNTCWFLITRLSFNIKHCENEAGPSCALAVSVKIPAGSTHASVHPYGPSALWTPLKEKSMTAESRTFTSVLKQDNERKFITTDFYWFELCISMNNQHKFFRKQSANQSVLLLLKSSHERVKVNRFSWSSV